MKKLIVCCVIATFVLLCACSPEGQNDATTTEDANTDTTQADFAHDEEWEGDIDLVDDTTEDIIEDDTTGSTENNTDTPRDTTEGEPFDPDFPIDVVDPAVTTEPNQDQNGENIDEPSEGGNTDEPSEGGNTDEPSEGGSSGGDTDEPNEDGNSSGGGIELPIIPG